MVNSSAVDDTVIIQCQSSSGKTSIYEIYAMGRTGDGYVDVAHKTVIAGERGARTVFRVIGPLGRKRYLRIGVITYLPMAYIS